MAAPLPLTPAGLLNQFVVYKDPLTFRSHIGQIVRHGAGGGAGAIRFQEWDEASRAIMVNGAGAAVASIAYTPALVTTTYLVFPSLNDLVIALKTLPACVVAVRFFSTQGQVRVTMDSGATSQRFLRTDPLTGDAIVLPWHEVGFEPFRAPAEVRFPFAKLGALTLWVPPAPIPQAAPAAAPLNITVVSQADTARNMDGTFRYKTSYSNGQEIKKSSPMMVLGAEWAGTSNAPARLAWSNPLIFLDPNWYPLMMVLPTTQETGTWEAGCQTLMGTDLSKERRAPAGGKPVTMDGRGHFFAARTEAVRNLVTTLQLLVASGATADSLHPVVLALITMFGCIVRRMEWTVSRPSAHLSQTPPWYYRELHPAGEKQPRDNGDN